MLLLALVGPHPHSLALLGRLVARAPGTGGPRAPAPDPDVLFTTCMGKPRFFRSAAECRAWLDKHHDTARELWFGFYKKNAGQTGISYREALDEALCFGWIDGLKKRVDDERYMMRFTPRQPKSVWSAVNVRRVEELRKQGLVAPSGLVAFERRDKAKTEQYSYERRTRGLDPRYERMFQSNRPAWTFFQSQAPSYRRTATWWVMSAKQEDTRQRRLAALIKRSANGSWPSSFIPRRAAGTPQPVARGRAR